MSKDDSIHFPLLLKESGGTVRATLHTHVIRHTKLFREEIKTRFANVEEYLSKESWEMNAYLGCEAELCELQAESASKNFFRKHGYKRFWVVKGHTVAPRLVKYAVTRIILPFSTTFLKPP